LPVTSIFRPSLRTRRVVGCRECQHRASRRRIILPPADKDCARPVFSDNFVASSSRPLFRRSYPVNHQKAAAVRIIAAGRRWTVSRRQVDRQTDRERERERERENFNHVEIIRTGRDTCVRLSWPPISGDFGPAARRRSNSGMRATCTGRPTASAAGGISIYLSLGRRPR